MGLGGIIAGALGGGAQAATDLASNQIAQNGKTELMNIQAQIEKDKLKFADELSRSRAEWEVDPNGLGGKKIANEMSRATQVGGAETGVLADREGKVGAVKATNEGLAAAARSAAETAESLKRFNDPSYIAGLTKVAKAQHVESSATLAQAALAKLQIGDATTAQNLRKELATARASGDEAAVLAVQQKITDNAFTGKDTAGAYKAYQSASIALIGAQEKLNDPSKMVDAATKAQIMSDIEDAKAMQRKAALDLGIKLPDKGAAPGAAVDPSKFDKDAKNPAAGKPAVPGAATSQAPSAVLKPDEVAAVSKQEAAAAQRREWDAQARARDAAALQAQKEDIGNLTAAQIQVLAPQRAQEILSKYSAVLTSEQRRALNKQL